VAEAEGGGAGRRGGGVPPVAYRREGAGAGEGGGPVLGPAGLRQADLLEPGGVVEEEGGAGAAAGADGIAVGPDIVDPGLAPADAVGKGRDLVRPVRVDRDGGLWDDRDRTELSPSSGGGVGCAGGVGVAGHAGDEVQIRRHPCPLPSPVPLPPPGPRFSFLLPATIRSGGAVRRARCAMHPTPGRTGHAPLGR